MLQKLGLAKSAQTRQGPVTLGRVFPSALIDLDATIASSYGGTGQLWANLVAAPADGAAGDAYDFYRGATAAVQADDPAFTGAAGDAGAYWLLDGNDAFKQVGSTPFLADLHKTGSGSFTAIAAFHHQPASSEQRLFSTQANGSSGPGITFGISGIKKIFLRQCGESGSSVASLIPVTLVNTDYVCIVSHDRPANQTRFWVNTRTGAMLAQSFQPGLGTSYPGVIGARATFDLEFLIANTRVYSFGLLNAAIGDTEAGLIYDLLNARHNRVYA